MKIETKQGRESRGIEVGYTWKTSPKNLIKIA